MVRAEAGAAVLFDVVGGWCSSLAPALAVSSCGGGTDGAGAGAAGRCSIPERSPADSMASKVVCLHFCRALMASSISRWWANSSSLFFTSPWERSPPSLLSDQQELVEFCGGLLFGPPAFLYAVDGQLVVVDVLWLSG